MSPAKTSLLDAIETLDEDKIQKALEFVQSLNEESGVSQTLERLKNDRGFKVPSGRPRRVSSLKPIKGKGIPASEFLIGDRR